MSNFPWIPIATAASIAVAIALGVFNPKRILGPQRLSPGESPLVLFRAIGFALAAWAISLLLIGAVHHSLTKQRNDPATTRLSDPETVIYSGVMELAVFAAMLAATLSTRLDGIRRVGISPRRIPSGLIAGAFAIALALPLIGCVDGLTQCTLEYLHKSPPPHQLLEILKSNPPPWLRAADVLAAGAVAPLAEEMFFRGLLQTLLRYLFKRSWPAVLLAAAAFAMMHSWWTWPQIFFLGICLGYAYERTGNLWMSITMHALFNLTSIWLFTHLT
ncbi:MAG: CPBP family intramembrane glutamic endopeptidase [Tepidisphaeraceae bacterium]|jgi:membrane protease YdiL (CAAX protease family)